MRLRPTRLICACLLFLVWDLCASAQTAPGSIRGHVVLPNGDSIHEAVMLRLESIRGVRSHSYTDNEGQFEFSVVQVGQYRLIVEPPKDRFETTVVDLEVFSEQPTVLTITLKEKGGTATTNSNETVTPSEADPLVPPAAKKEFDRAAALIRESKHEDAIAALRKAVALYPRYLMALNDLGTELLAVGKLEEATTELRRAMAIDAKAFNPHLNLGIVLVEQHEFTEARQELQTAVALRSNAPAARLYLGIALTGLDESGAAEVELKKAYSLGGTKYAVSLYHLGQIYLNQNKRDEAVKMLERYLIEEPNGKHAEQARKLIAAVQ
jgi:tetratricopeptide (TPR) repeat protein